MKNTDLRLSKFNAFVFDMDGVLRIGKKPVSGAGRAIGFLKKKGRKVAVLTNNATRSRRGVAAALRALGVPISSREVVCSAYGTARLLREKFGPAKCFVVGEKGLKSELRQAGHAVVGEKESAEAEFVVVGLDHSFNYRKIAAAQRAILSGAKFVATNRDPMHPTEEGIRPGAGTMVAAIAAASRREPDITVGKPSTYLLRIALAAMRATPGETVIVGDSVELDIAMAKKAKMKSVLVLTGSTPCGQAGKIPARMKPDAVLESVAEIPERW